MNNIIARYVSFLKQKNLITNISSVTDMHEVFPDSISHEGNWTDFVPNHDNEHVVAWAISMLFVLGNQLPNSNQSISIIQSNKVTCPVCAWIHPFHELDKSRIGISITSYGTLLSANCPHTCSANNQVFCFWKVDELI